MSIHSTTRIRLSEEISQIWQIEREEAPSVLRDILREPTSARILRAATDLAKATEDLVIVEDNEGVELARIV